MYSRSLLHGIAFTLATVLRAQEPGPAPATEALLNAWDRHTIVAVAELHRYVQDKEFLLELIKAPKFAGKVNDIVIEFGNALHQPRLDRYMQGKRIDPAALRAVWADTTPANGVWEAPIYRQLLTGIQQRNKKLPKRQKIRVLACDPPIDWQHVQTIKDAAPNLNRDKFCADLLRSEVYDKGRRALVIMGGNHLARRHMNGSTPRNVVTMIEESHPGSVFSVLTWHGELKDKDSIEQKLGAAPVPSLTPTHGTWLGKIPAQPFKPLTRTRVGSGQAISQTVAITNPPNLDQMGDAMLYVGPSAALTRSAPTPADFTPDDLRELERRHQILFGLPLDRDALFR